MYKSKLQELCQQQQWALPRYTCMKDGPDHNPSFKSSVFLNGMSFHSSPSCKSFKESQNDAAKSAFLHFSSSSSSAATPDAVQKVVVGLYKKLLQQLTEREGLSSNPEYKTVKFGRAHSPTFFSTVEVEGVVYHGEGGKSKKEAELNAAKVAYTNLIDEPPPDGDYLVQRMSTLKVVTAAEEKEYDEEQEDKAGQKLLLNATTSPDYSESVLVSPKQGSFSSRIPINFPVPGLQDRSSKLYLPDNITTASLEKEEPDEGEDMKAGEKVVANATTSPDNSSCSKTVPVSAEEGSPSSTLTHVDISGPSIADSTMKEDPELRSYLLNNRVRVYSSFPNIAFPQGITVLPISEDKWVAVSLEFPNERLD
ncbi:Double-stranded RNA-binding protein [Corchorus capsularis]|uniref:Double-stranded RNA-binding protein n=1 Tax=Corchorus capsularis TaxID=210143 RepID=A0A1R3HL93_COCAP|nr:Double-stranded RNA-binding protein [Corchorus capsularis]